MRTLLEGIMQPTLSQWLMITVLFPAVAGLLISGLGNRRARGVALLVTIGVAGLSIFLLSRALGNGGAVTPIRVDIPWLGESSAVDLRFTLSLDGVSLWLFGLSSILFVTAVLVSWQAIDRQQSLFYGLLLLLETGCLGVFTARDVLLFYTFFEFTLIPLFLLIGIWGSEDRRRAAGKFFLYTLAGSLLTFLSILTIVLWCFWVEEDSSRISFSMEQLTASLSRHPMPIWMEHLTFWGLFVGFAVKVPLFPLHTWLPLAHVQAPAAGSIILAGLLLKIGTYGFLRFSIPMLPVATAAAVPYLLVLAVAGIVYGALVALAQTDMKRLIAYSSVSHLGFCILGLFALNPMGVEGSLLQMVNHGISTGALFALVGMIYERYHTREISQLGGLAAKHPWLAFFMVLFTFSSIGLPGLNGFAGEILILLGMFQRGWMESPGWLLKVVSVVSITGVVFGAWYMLWLVQRVFFGPEHGGGHGVGHKDGAGHGFDPKQVSDMTWREILALLPLTVLVFWIGVYPEYFLRVARPELRQITSIAADRLALASAVSPSPSQLVSVPQILAQSPISQSAHDHVIDLIP